MQQSLVDLEVDAPSTEPSVDKHLQDSRSDASNALRHDLSSAKSTETCI